jgi:hypothetical protein
VVRDEAPPAARVAWCSPRPRSSPTAGAEGGRPHRVRPPIARAAGLTMLKGYFVTFSNPKIIWKCAAGRKLRRGRAGWRRPPSSQLAAASPAPKLPSHAASVPIAAPRARDPTRQLRAAATGQPSARGGGSLLTSPEVKFTGLTHKLQVDPEV